MFANIDWNKINKKYIILSFVPWLILLILYSYKIIYLNIYYQTINKIKQIK
jgi:hypothetical protein